MADKRINALTTTSASVGDDYFAIDGATNGTRALSAFSPTFGGNATVTGTLTANSAITGPTLAPGVNTAAHYFTAYGATTSWPLRLSTIYDSNYVDQYLTLNGTLTGSRATPTFTGAAVGGSFIRSNGETSVLSVGTFVSGAGAAINTVAVFNPTNVTIPQTTASTTTSTGALVVGNGTSGGLGVGGSINAGDNISSVNPQGKIQIQGTGNTTGVKEINLLRSDGGDACTFGLTGSAYAGVLTGLGNSEAFIYNAGSFRVFIGTAATNRFDFTSSQFKINPTTASTSTSSGALVVSGGVGVAGAIVAGGAITSTASTDSGLLQLNLVNSSTGTSASSLFRFNAGTRTASLQAYNDTHATLAGQLRVSTSNGDIVVIPSGVTAATFTASGTTFAGAISIGNTVNTVSPTNPNRTITMVIGGTTYYLAAKTTND